MPSNSYTTEIINRFLFDQAQKPADLTDKALIRDAGVKGTSVQIDANWYMTDGPGRFAQASLSPIVQSFFENVEKIKLTNNDDTFIFAGKGSIIDLGGDGLWTAATSRKSGLQWVGMTANDNWVEWGLGARVV